MQIKYVGQKVDGERAFEAETQIVWFPGSSHPITDKKVLEKMLQHPGVFAEDTETQAPGLSAVAGPAVAITTESQAAKALDPITVEQMADLDDAALRELAEAHGLKKPHHTKKGDALREAILESQAAKA